MQTGKQAEQDDEGRPPTRTDRQAARAFAILLFVNNHKSVLYALIVSALMLPLTLAWSPDRTALVPALIGAISAAWGFGYVLAEMVSTARTHKALRAEGAQE